MQAMEWWEPDTFVCLGDMADFYKISRFPKSPLREENFDAEVDSVNQGLDEIDSLSSLSRKIFIEGNHEHRLTRYLQEKAPELFSFVNTQKLFKLEERGYEFVPYRESIKVGKLWITHDVGTAGRYSVFRAADTFQHPVVMAHTHRLVYIVEGNATGEHFPAAQFGWMGDVEKVDYAHKVVAQRSWSLAFGTGLLYPETGIVHLTPHPIVAHEGKFSVVLDGRRFAT